MKNKQLYGPNVVKLVSVVTTLNDTEFREKSQAPRRAFVKSKITLIISNIPDH